MRIAILISIEKGSVGIDDFRVRLFFSLAEQQPYHQFIFLMIGRGKAAINFPHNAEVIFIKPLLKVMAFEGWLNNLQLAGTLKKLNADVCINYNRFFSLSTKVPQVLVVSDPEFIHLKPTSVINKKALPILSKANIICTVSAFVRQEIISHCKVSEDSIINIGFFVGQIFQPATTGNNEIIKEAYADGYEYFLFPVTAYTKDHFVNVLKAFSLFKKRQKSNMKLLVIGAFKHQLDNVTDKLKSFKYRDDVRLLHNINFEEAAKIYSAGYAVLFPCNAEVFAVEILQAMQCEVPVITSNTKSIAELGEDALLYADAFNPQDIAEQIKTIFKDEQLRSNLINAAKQKAEAYNAQTTTAMLWQAIQQAVINN